MSCKFLSSFSADFPYQKKFLPLAKKILKAESKDKSVNVILCSDEEQRVLNRDFRKLDKVTDVLSFEWHEPNFLGEIYIARDQVKRQAPQYDNTYFCELKRVLIHGLLHLCGYDHHTKQERKIMREKENYYYLLAYE
ncbi:hypothetical protein AGMMS49938_13900 [Fibrobacterales bacterium]|nr:hypothetical protein AGMMS49938_13900 [Fibrobacterales bacterium]